jgi:arylsulfatase A-like enzyme
VNECSGRFLLCALLGALMACGDSSSPGAPQRNILLIIMDDVGQDQLGIFNPAADTPAQTPNIDAVASAGVLFTDTTAMPECSPSRAAIFTGRYPFRTGVTAAILFDDQPRAQVSPFEVTAPEVLRTAGYKSAMLGKFHLGGPDNNPDGNRTPAVLGWDYYNGNLQGGPPPIDQTLGCQYLNAPVIPGACSGQTAGSARIPSALEEDSACGQASPCESSDRLGESMGAAFGDAPEDGAVNLFPCGFPLGEVRAGCWRLNGQAEAYFDDNDGQGYTGKQCLELGGISAVDTDGNLLLQCDGCEAPNFEVANGYYVWPRVVNEADGASALEDLPREYMSTFQTDAAIEWINRQNAGGGPWMATVSFDSIHTPYQPPPDDLYPPDFQWPDRVSQNCDDLGAQRVLSNLMTSAMDREIGRLLVETGLAVRDEEGALIYDPDATNTTVILVGDNGTFYPGVKAPYNLVRSKGTPYQTGILVPLIVAGPNVEAGGREVESMINIADLFELFGEIAGVDVRSVVPQAHRLDSRPMLQYLTSPDRSSDVAREFNFAQLGDGLKKEGTIIYPCVLSLGPIRVCTDILFSSEALCEAYQGEWFGPTYANCCELKESADGDENMRIVPSRVWAMRNENYKLVVQDLPECEQEDDDANACEFYDLSPEPDNPINPLGLDNAPSNLLSRGSLSPEERENFELLQSALVDLLASEAECTGDGNLDKKVDDLDLEGIETYRDQPSVFDFNDDGTTNDADREIVLANFGAVCEPPGPVDLPSCAD